MDTTQATHGHGKGDERAAECGACGSSGGGLDGWAMLIASPSALTSEGRIATSENVSGSQGDGFGIARILGTRLIYAPGLSTPSCTRWVGRLPGNLLVDLSYNVQSETFLRDLRWCISVRTTSGEGVVSWGNDVPSALSRLRERAESAARDYCALAGAIAVVLPVRETEAA